MTIKRYAAQTFAPILALAASGHAIPLTAAPGSSTSLGVASARVVEPLTVSELNPLEFGGIAVSAAQPGQVVVNAVTGAASYSGSATPICASVGRCAAQAAQFAVAGEDDRRYRVVLPTGAYAVRTDGVGPDLLVSDLVSASRNLPGAPNTGLLDESGNDRVSIGGTLSIPAATPPGNYAAEISLVLTYN